MFVPLKHFLGDIQQIPNTGEERKSNLHISSHYQLVKSSL